MNWYGVINYMTIKRSLLITTASSPHYKGISLIYMQLNTATFLAFKGCTSSCLLGRTSKRVKWRATTCPPTTSKSDGVNNEAQLRSKSLIAVYTRYLYSGLETLLCP